MRKKIVCILICTLLIITIIPAIGTSNDFIISNNIYKNKNTSFSFHPGEFIVKFTNETALTSPSINELNKKYEVSAIEELFKNAENTRLDHIYVLRVPEKSDILSIATDYSSCSNIVYAEPDYIGELCMITNDEFFSFQWALNNYGQCGGIPDADIDAVEAWDIETGDPDVVIASIDTGVEYTHPDLAENIWVNDDEIPNNGIDDDGNGYVDDVNGWDFYDDDNTPMDTHGHGTCYAGVHSMVANNEIGGAGVCWGCKTMPIRWTDGLIFKESLLAQGIQYATDNDADVLNIEICIPWYPHVIKDAVDYAYERGCFICVPAGNNNTDSKKYPAAFENTTAVAATNQNDERCDEDDWGPGSGSNYGDWIDIAAPGAMIFTTSLGSTYTFGGGTSGASPHVAGVAALLLSKDPSLTPDEIKEIICDEDNVDPYKSEEYIGTGRLNAYKVLSDPVQDVPVWQKGDSWKYEIIEIARSDPDETMKYTITGDLVYTVVDDTGDYYVLEGNVKSPIVKLKLMGLNLKESKRMTIKYDTAVRKSDLGICSYNFMIKGIMLIVLGQLTLSIPIQLKYHYNSEFSPPRPIIPFQLHDGKNGTYKEVVEKLDQGFSLFWGLIPLQDYNIFQISSAVNFNCHADKVTVPAGTFDVYNISTTSHLNKDYIDLFYNDTVGNVVGHTIRLHDPFHKGEDWWWLIQDFKLKSTTYAP